MRVGEDEELRSHGKMKQILETKNAWNEALLFAHIV